jgi:hypothetical protein
MRTRIVVAAFVPLFYCCSLAHAYSQEEVNRVEVPPEDTVVQMKADGPAAQLASPQAAPNNDVIPASLVKTLEPIATKASAAAP